MAHREQGNRSIRNIQPPPKHERVDILFPFAIDNLFNLKTTRFQSFRFVFSSSSSFFVYFPSILPSFSLSFCPRERTLCANRWAERVSVYFYSLTHSHYFLVVFGLLGPLPFHRSHILHIPGNNNKIYRRNNNNENGNESKSFGLTKNLLALHKN